RVLDEDGIVTHVRCTLDRRGNHVLDTLPADEQMTDIGGTEDSVEVGALETVGAEIDHDGLVAHGPEGIDDIDLPGADDAFVLILGTLQQRVMLVLRQFGKAGTPADIDEDGKKPAIACGGEHALRIFDRVVLLDLPAEIFAPDTFWIADAVLPMQHQQRGFRRYSFGHRCFLPGMRKSQPRAETSKASNGAPRQRHV